MPGICLFLVGGVNFAAGFSFLSAQASISERSGFSCEDGRTALHLVGGTPV